MAQIKLRGLKLLEGGAQVAPFQHYGENLPAAGLCSLLSGNKINITFLVHVSAAERAGCTTVLCTEGSEGRASASLIEARLGRKGSANLRNDVATLSVFPHDQRPHVTGKLLEAFADNARAVLGIESTSLSEDRNVCACM